MRFMKQKCRMGPEKIPAFVLVRSAFSCLVFAEASCSPRQPNFDVHHAALDVLPSVAPRELEFQSVAMATLAYILAQEGI